MADTRLEPRKVPTQLRARATVAAILEAAAHILEESGQAAFNTNAVAARAGASVGSLYQYFPNKDALFAALVRENATARSAAIATAATGTDNADAALRAMIRAAVANQLERPRLGRILDEVEARLPLDADLREDRARLLAIVSEVLRRRLAKRSDLEMVALDLFGIVRGMVDAAGSWGVTKREIDQISSRIEWAVFGYLENAVPPEA